MNRLFFSLLLMFPLSRICEAEIVRIEGTIDYSAALASPKIAGSTMAVKPTKSDGATYTISPYDELGSVVLNSEHSSSAKSRAYIAGRGYFNRNGVRIGNLYTFEFEAVNLGSGTTYNWTALNAPFGFSYDTETAKLLLCPCMPKCCSCTCTCGLTRLPFCTGYTGPGGCDICHTTPPPAGEGGTDVETLLEIRTILLAVLGVLSMMFGATLFIHFGRFMRW